MLYSIGCPSPFGELTLYQQGDAIVLLRHPGDDFFPDALRRDTPLLCRGAEQLTQYFAGTRQVFDLPLAPQGSPFFQTIWRTMLREIPYGQTRTYGQVGLLAGYPRHARGVGAANRCCPISIIIPCHRVVAAGGKLGGYGSNPEAKQFLLDLEQANRP